jgi:hypothetical protein
MKKKNLLWKFVSQIFVYILVALEARIIAVTLGAIWYNNQNWFYHFSQSGSLSAKDIALTLAVGLYGATALAIINNILKKDIERKDEDVPPDKFSLTIKSHALMFVISSIFLFFAASWYYSSIEEGRVVVSAVVGILYLGWRITVLMDNPNYTTINIFRMIWRWLKS